jgi:hypothetical protein
MLEYLRSIKENRTNAGRRRLRLYACACCHRVQRLMKDRRRRWLDTAERFAEGTLSKEAVAQEDRKLGRVDHLKPDKLADCAAWFTLSDNVIIAAQAAPNSAASALAVEAWQQVRDEAEYRRHRSRETAHNAVLLREVFGNPFRAYPAPSSWPSTVVQLADSLYNGHDCSFALHDALLEAGHAELAEHFKEKEHPKGCWAMDLIL